MNNSRTYTGDWDRIGMILRELELATWVVGTVHRVVRQGSVWSVTFSTRHA